MTEVPPKDVCPSCGSRGCFKDPTVSVPHGTPPYLAKRWRCPSCGDVCARSQLCHYEPHEREEVRRRHNEENARWNREHPEQRRSAVKRYEASEKGKATRRARYRVMMADSEKAAEKRAKSREYARKRYAEDPEPSRAAARKWHQAHREELKLYNKRYALRKYREAHADGRA